MGYPASLNRLISALKTLPGVGTRTAERLAFHLLRGPEAAARELADALVALRANVVSCSRCFNLSEQDPCEICSDERREREKLLVVEQPRDVVAFEEAGWRGGYHVLLGHVNPLEGIEVDDLTLAALAARVQEGDVEEVVVATNPDYEGDATALHVVKALDGLDVRVSRIARGVASGSAIEYSNAAMLADAISGRSALERGP